MNHAHPNFPRRLRATIATLAFAALTACTGAPEGVEPVMDFEL